MWGNVVLLYYLQFAKPKIALKCQLQSVIFFKVFREKCFVKFWLTYVCRFHHLVLNFFLKYILRF